MRRDGGVRWPVLFAEASSTDGCDMRRDGGVRWPVLFALLSAFGTAVSTSVDDGNSTGTQLLVFGIRSGHVALGRIVSLRSVADTVYPRAVSLVVELLQPLNQVIVKVEALHSVEPSGSVRGSSHQILDVKGGFCTGIIDVVGTNNLSNRVSIGERNELGEELLQIARGIVLGLELGDSVSALGVLTNQAS